MKQSIRERVAVVLTTLAVGFSIVMTVAVVSAYNQNRGGTAFVGGGVLGTTGDTTGDTSGQAGGGTAGGSSGGGGGGSSTQTAAQAGALAASQAASGVTSGKITVGGIYDMTGPVDSSVERDTVRAYFDKVNASGGVNGRRLQLIDCDSRYDVTVASQCANQMIDNHVLSVVGWTAPKGEDEQVSKLTQAGIPVVGGLGTPAEFASPLSYPVSVNFTLYGKAIAARAKELGIHHPAIVVIADVSWILPVLSALTDALHAQGIQETYVDKASATQASYAFDVSQLKANGTSDSLLTALDPFSYTRLFSAMDTANWHPKVLGVGLDKGTSQSSYGDQISGNGGANSVVPFLSPYDNAGNVTVHDYLNTMNTYYPGKQYKALDIYTQHSWTAAMVFVEAVRRAGANLTRQTLVNALNSIQNFDTGWSKPLSYGSGLHDPNRCFRWTTHDPTTADAGGSWHTTSDWRCF